MRYIGLVLGVLLLLGGITVAVLPVSVVRYHPVSASQTGTSSAPNLDSCGSTFTALGDPKSDCVAEAQNHLLWTLVLLAAGGLLTVFSGLAVRRSRADA